LQQTDADPWVQTYDCDGARRMTNTTSPAGCFNYAYDATAQLLVKKLSLPNGAYITNDYDSVARLLDTWLKNSGNTNLNSHSYSYNVGNQRTSQTRTAGDYVDYGYDRIGQLTNAAGKETGGVTNRLLEELTYAYDAAHNLNYRTNNTLVEDFTVNSLNELSNVTHGGTLTVEGTTGAPATNVTVNGSNATLYLDNTFAATNFTATNGNNAYTAIASDALGRSSSNTVTVYLPATNSYTYDLNGNLLSDGTRTFAYNDENQMISVIVSNGSITSTLTTNIYDGKFRRRIRRESIWQSGSWIQTNEVRYIYDGNMVIQERDGNNLPTATYACGKDLSGTLQRAGGIGGLLARWDRTTRQAAFYHSDGDGNVTAMINSLQFIVAKYLYDPYGNILSLNGPMADVNLYRFSSREWYQNSGLVCYSRRFYDPNLQRWLNRDPINEVGGINLYNFIGNSPNNYVDPLGLAFGDYWDVGATANYYNQASANGLNQGGFSGYAKFVGAQLGEGIMDFFGAGGVQQSAQQSGADSVNPCHRGRALGYGALTAGTILANAIPGEGEAAALAEKQALRFSSEKEALVAMAQLDKKIGKGISEADMQAYQDLNKELGKEGFPANKVRLDPGHSCAGPHAQIPHGHVGPVDYIPIKKQ